MYGFFPRVSGRLFPARRPKWSDQVYFTRGFLGVLKSFIRFRVPGGFARGFFVRLRKCVGLYWHVFNEGFLQFYGKCMRRVSKGVYYEVLGTLGCMVVVV